MRRHRRNTAFSDPARPGGAGGFAYLSGTTGLRRDGVARLWRADRLAADRGLCHHRARRGVGAGASVARMERSGMRGFTRSLTPREAQRFDSPASASLTPDYATP